MSQQLVTCRSTIAPRRGTYYVRVPPSTVLPRSSLWRNHVVAILYAGQFVSLVGSGASTIAFPLLVLALTHSPWLAGVIGALRLLPYAVLGLLAGVLVDRWNRSRVLLWCEFARIVLLGSLPLAALVGHLTWVQVGVVALLEGTCFTFVDLALTAALPQLVAEEQINAVAHVHVTVANSAQLVGPALGGFLFSVGRTFPMLADALSYLASLVSLWWIRARLHQDGPPVVSASLREELRAGLRWLWRNAQMRDLALICAGANLALSAFPLLLILDAQRAHVDAVGTGAIVGASGFGAVLGPLLASRLPRQWGMATIGGGSLLLTALCWLGTAVAGAPLLIALCATAAMSAEQVFNTVQFATRLALIPQELQGRLQAVYRLLLMVAQPIGLALMGALAGLVGVHTTLLIGAGLICSVAVLAFVDPALAGRFVFAESRVA